LLEEMGFKFSIQETRVEEIYPSHLIKDKHAEFLSAQKAAAVSIDLEEELVIAADTVVYLGELHLGKPANANEAKLMLQLLSGKRHDVITGVTLRSLEMEHTFSCLTQVHFSIFEDRHIDTYINKFQPFDKAGAYGIQELVSPGGEQIGPLKIEKIEGSYTNVMGLPVEELAIRMDEFLIR